MRRKISITILQSVSHHLKTSFTQLHKCQRGAIAIIFAIILVPILAFIGVALDLSNLNSKRAEMQHVIDDAVLSVQKDISKTTTEKEVKNSLKAILAAKLPLKTGMYKIVTTQFNKRAGAVGIVVEGKVNVLFSHIYTLVGLDKRFASYLVTSGTVSDTTAYYVNYYFLLDNSSSMLFAATDHEAGRLKRATVIPCIDSGINKAPDCSVYPKKLRDTRIHNDMHNGCEFACHSRELLAADPPPPMQDSKVPQWRLMIQNLLRTQAAIPIRYRTFSGFKKYPTAFHAARAKNIKLRTDVTAESVSRILDLMLKNDPTGKYTRVAIYYFNLTTEKKFRLAPLTKTRAERIKRTLTLKTISGDGLSSKNRASGDHQTDFENSLSELGKDMVSDGDGSSRSKAKNLVLMVTDGLESIRLGSLRYVVAPINPRWCDPVKDKGILSIVHTPYRPIHDNYDASDRLATDWNLSWHPSKYHSTLAYNDTKVIEEIKKRIAAAPKGGHVGRGKPLYGLYTNNNQYNPSGYNYARMKKAIVHDTLYPMLMECASKPTFAAMAGTKSEDDILDSLKDILGKLGALPPHLLQ